jgi:hypothetical protein
MDILMPDSPCPHCQRLQGALQILGIELLDGGGMRLTQRIYVKWYEAERKRIEKELLAEIERLRKEVEGLKNEKT